MIVYNQGRGTGKSVRLLIISDYTGTPIVVSTKARKDYLEAQKKMLNCDNAKVVLLEDLREADIKDVFVDEGYSLLTHLMKRIFGVEIKVATDTIPFHDISVGKGAQTPTYAPPLMPKIVPPKESEK